MAALVHQFPRLAWPAAAVLCALALAAPARGAEKQPTAPVVDLEQMVQFTAGSFWMGQEFAWCGAYGCEWFMDQVPAHEVELAEFYLDRFEVTVAEFALFLTYAAGEYHYHPDQPIERVAGGYLPIAGREQLPIVYVSWEAAQHYCRWAGKRLPTEAEWERAAAGTDVREYPWGGDLGPSCARAVYFPGSSYCEDGPLPVGSRPEGATPEGISDLAGNVAEWVADYYQWDYYAESPASDPPGPAEGTLRAVRGGGYLEWRYALRTRARRSADPDSRSANLGFRCAWSAEPADVELRGALDSPADTGREPTDRPLAPPAPVPEEIVAGLTNPREIVELDGAWFVLDPTAGAVYEVGDGAEVAELLVDGFDTAVDLATDGADLYVADQGSGAVVRVDTAGDGGPLAESQSGVARVLADPAGPCWLYDDGIACHDEVDGTQLLVAASGVTDLILTSDHVWYTVRDAPEVGIWRVPRSGGTPEQLLEGPVYDGHFPAALVRDETNATLYFWAQRDGWPSSAVLCALADGALDAECFAYSPPKPVKPRVAAGTLYWITQYTIVAIDPSVDESYRVIGTWATSDGLIAGEDHVVWTDAANGRVWRAVP
jgi:formylglycine-generating enzyme required for sulfatase activity